MLELFTALTEIAGGQAVASWIEGTWLMYWSFWGVVYALISVTMALWAYRIVANSASLGIQNIGFSPIGAALRCLVPVANLGLWISVVARVATAYDFQGKSKRKPSSSVSTARIIVGMIMTAATVALVIYFEANWPDTVADDLFFEAAAKVPIVILQVHLTRAIQKISAVQAERAQQRSNVKTTAPGA